MDLFTADVVVALGLAALAFAWIVSMVVYAITVYYCDKGLAKLMEDFRRRFPDRCFLCSYYRNVMIKPPPPHDCARWTGGQDRLEK